MLEKVEQYGLESFGGIFVCGDFNDVATSPAVQAMLASGGSGKIQFQHAYASYQVPSSSAKASSSKSPPPPAQAVTIFTPQVTEFIDYIFY
jgi:mRNA deadenylase 3'-5' endonuclease subunit Ccr4